MFKRIMTVSAALVLMTGVAGTAHADRVLVTNNTGHTLNFQANGVKFTKSGHLNNEKSLVMAKADAPRMLDFGQDYRLSSLCFGVGGGGNVIVIRHPRAKDPERLWKITVSRNQQGEITFQTEPNLQTENVLREP